LRDGDQDLGGERRAARRQRRRNGHREHGVDASAQPGRHHLDHLGQRADGGLLHPGDGPLGGRLHADGQGHRLVVVHHERGQGGARGELVPAVDAAGRLDGVAEVAQPVDVPPHRAHRDVEPLGEFGARPVPVGLQEREQP